MPLDTKGTLQRLMMKARKPFKKQMFNTLHYVIENKLEADPQTPSL